MPARSAYAGAGVDVAAADRAVDLLRSRLTVSPLDALGGIGGFGAALELPAGYHRPVLVSGADGVGTKTEIARRLGRFDTIGQDLVAMCADDIVCHGARPLFLLDYLAVGKVDPVRVAEIVGGVSAACDAVGCVLAGGETAEHPGLMEDDAFDLAGFCVGVVERDELIDGSDSHAGDALIGMASSGLHANGFSLVRKLVDEGSLRLDAELLTPTRLYAAGVLRLVDDLRAVGLRLGGLAHITGGGLAGNLPRAVPDGLAVSVDIGSWPAPEIFDAVAVAARIDGQEMRATFNCGIGMAAIVEPDAVDNSLESLAASGIEAWPIGRIVERRADGARYIEVA